MWIARVLCLALIRPPVGASYKCVESVGRLRQTSIVTFGKGNTARISLYGFIYIENELIEYRISDNDILSYDLPARLKKRLYQLGSKIVDITYSAPNDTLSLSLVPPWTRPIVLIHRRIAT